MVPYKNIKSGIFLLVLNIERRPRPHININVDTFLVFFLKKLIKVWCMRCLIDAPGVYQASEFTIDDVTVHPLKMFQKLVRIYFSKL